MFGRTCFSNIFNNFFNNIDYTSNLYIFKQQLKYNKINFYISKFNYFIRGYIHFKKNTK